MNPLATIYGGIVAARNALYDRRWCRARRLIGPVVSIGNLCVGGSGKTPFVLCLGELLKARGVKFDVLSRGYGRKSRGVLLVDPAGLPQDYGDEPLLIARKLQVPVIVGESRFEAGRFAENRFGPQLHLLDDGFQHRALARDFDVVLITEDDLTGRLLPAGRQREPLSSLRRADAIVVTGDITSDLLPVSGKFVWRLRRGLVPASFPARAVVFCGIARPQNFIAQLQQACVLPVAEAFYRDHHTYTEKDIRELLDLKQRTGADGFVTTEKDAVNLGGYLNALQPLGVAQVETDLDDAANVVDTILRTIRERKRQP